VRPIERWLARRIVDTVQQELLETREELTADLATLVELTAELERIASRLEARLDAADESRAAPPSAMPSA
jgi:hypothetical protein